MNNIKIIIFSFIVCLLGTVIGYFCLFIGGHISHDTKEFSVFLIPGYLLMWPALLFGYVQNTITGNNTIGYISGGVSQILGYIFMGYLYSYALKTIKNT